MKSFNPLTSCNTIHRRIFNGIKENVAPYFSSYIYGFYALGESTHMNQFSPKKLTYNKYDKYALS